MARQNQEAIDTFMNITGATEEVALQKLEEHHGDLNEAVNSHFSEGDRNIPHPTPAAVPQHDMDIDDDLVDLLQVEPQRPALPLPSVARNLNPFPLLDPNFGRSFFEGRGLTTGAPLVSHPREVREIPIEVKDGNYHSSHSGSRPVIEDITGTASVHGPEIHGRVIIDDEDEEGTPTISSAHVLDQSGRRDGFSHDEGILPRSTAPELDYGNDIEEEMIRAAIEASKQEVEHGLPNQQFGVPSGLSGPRLQQRESPLADVELARAVSLSIKTAEQEKALREQGKVVGATGKGVIDSSNVEEMGNLMANGRQEFGSLSKGSSSQVKLEAGSSSVQDEKAKDVEEQPLVRSRSRLVSSGSMESLDEVREMDECPPTSPGPRDNPGRLPHNEDTFPSEWGGISSEEHDEAVMLEAALFGGIPEGTAYNFAYPSHQTRNMGLYPSPAPRPPSPTLTAQRLLKEQQDDEYLASLQADREKAEALRLEEQAAREAALEEERQKEEEARKKLLEEEEFERKLAVKQASLPMEPASDDENAVNLLIRMPDGSRLGRRFLKSDKLQSLFDFIEVGRLVKPGTYRLVRPYPRRAFSDGEGEVSLSELGLTSKQEALFLESF